MEIAKYSDFFSETEEASELFKIGEIAKYCGVTRKTLLVYEEEGVLTPAYVNPESGFRYYSADNMARVRSIRELQSIGLSLKEIKHYFGEPGNADAYLKRLMDLRDEIDRSIQVLQMRNVKHGDLTIHRIHLPRLVVYASKERCTSTSQIIHNIRKTDVAAVKTGYARKNVEIFTVWFSTDESDLDIMACTPVDDKFDGPERYVLEESEGICIYFRGPYYQLRQPRDLLIKYANDNNLEIAGPLRFAYIDTIFTYGDKLDEYLTKVILPVKSFNS